MALSDLNLIENIIGFLEGCDRTAGSAIVIGTVSDGLENEIRTSETDAKTEGLLDRLRRLRLKHGCAHL